MAGRVEGSEKPMTHGVPVACVLCLLRMHVFGVLEASGSWRRPGWAWDAVTRGRAVSAVLWRGVKRFQISDFRCAPSPACAASLGLYLPRPLLALLGFFRSLQIRV